MLERVRLQAVLSTIGKLHIRQGRTDKPITAPEARRSSWLKKSCAK